MILDRSSAGYITRFLMMALSIGWLWSCGQTSTSRVDSERESANDHAVISTKAPTTVVPIQVPIEVAEATAPAAAAVVQTVVAIPPALVPAELLAGTADDVIPPQVEVWRGDQAKRIRLVRVDEKFPLRRREEVLTRRNGVVSVTSVIDMVADHFLVSLKPGQNIEQALAAAGCSVRRVLPGGSIALASFEYTNHHSYTLHQQRLAAQATIRTAESDFIVHAIGEPSDGDFGALWGMHNVGQGGGVVDADIDAVEAWDIHTGSKNVLVGVIDTGIDRNHPDLAANMWQNPGETGTDANGNAKQSNGIDDDANGYVDDWRGWDFVNGDNNPHDDHYHGTHCAGTIGGVGNNGQGVAGVCWNVSLVGLKFLGAGGSGSISDAVEATLYGTKIGCALTSNSWGGGGYSQALKDAIDAAGVAGKLFVAAAGNAGSDTDISINYPSSYDSANIISVAATDRYDGLANFSNYGVVTVDLGAPGVDTFSTALNGGYQYLSGTSMATPHVAGACALLAAANPSLSASQIKQVLLSTVDPISSLSGKTVTGGRLNVFTAVQQVSGPVLTVVSKSMVDGGNKNGVLNPGEAGSLTVTIASSGSEPLTEVVGTLALSHPAISIVDGSVKYGSVPIGLTAVGDGPFKLQVATSAVTPLTVDGVITFTGAIGGPWSAPVTVAVYTSATLSGTVKTKAGLAIPGATVNWTGPATGSAIANASGVYKASLIAGTYQVSASAPTYAASVPQTVTVPPNKSVSFVLGKPDIVISPTALSLTSVEYQGASDTLTITNAGDSTLTGSFAQPVTWTASGMWHESSYRSVDGSSWYYGQESTRNYDNGSTNSGALETKVMVPVNAPTLTFREWRQTEQLSYYDLSQVQVAPVGSGDVVSIHAQAWTTVYQSSWQGDWTQVVVDLSAFAGQQISLRFFFNTVDSYANSYEGWYIDDVRLGGAPLSNWLMTTPSTFTVEAGKSTTVDVTTLGLPGGVYQSSLLATSNDPDQSAVVVPVTFMSQGTPNLSSKIVISPTSLSLTAVENQGGIDTLTIKNEGNATLTGNFAESPSFDYWLMTTPSTFVVEPGQSTFVYVTTYGLPAGFYSSSLEVISNDPDQPSLNIPVTFTSLATPELKAVNPVWADNASPAVGDGDGWFEPGETVSLWLTVSNTGSANATNVTGLIATANPNLTILSGTLNIIDLIPPGGEVVSGPYVVLIGAGHQSPADVDVVFNGYVNNTNGWASTVPLHVDSRSSLSGVAKNGKGVPLQEVLIQVDGVDSILTGVDGSYVVTGLTAGSHALTASRAGFISASTTITVPGNATWNPVLGSRQLTLTPSAITVRLAPNKTVTKTMKLKSTGSLPVTWSVSPPYYNWMTVTPMNGITASGGTKTLSLAFSSADLSYGTYQLFLPITSDVTDGSSTTIQATMEVASANAPVAHALSVQGQEDSVLFFTPVGEDADGDQLSYQVVDAPLHGTLSYSYWWGGEMTYTPQLNFSGTDSFTFRVFDGFHSSGTATVFITVEPVNDAPVLKPIAIVMTGAGSRTVTLQATDVDSPSVTIALAGQPAYGTATLVGSELTYTTDGKWFGADAIPLTLSDDASTVAVTVPVSITSSAFTWTTQGNSPAHTGVAPGSVTNFAAPTLAWSQSLSAWLNPPVVANGMIYTSGIGYQTGMKLWGVPLASGGIAWEKEFPNGYSLNPPTVVGESVYLQRGNHTGDSQLFKVNALTGDTIWSSPFYAQWERYFAPCLANGKIYVNGGSHGGLYAYDDATGAQDWFVERPQLDQWTPAFANGRLFSYIDATFTEHSLVDGSALWEVLLPKQWGGYSMMTTPTIVGNVAVALDNAGGSVSAIDLTTKTVRFTRTSGYFGVASAQGNSLFVMNGYGLDEINLTTGALIRAYPSAPTGFTGIQPQPVILSDAVILSDGYDTRCYKRGSTTLQWSVPHAGYLALAGPYLVISRDELLTTYRLPNRHPVFSGSTSYTIAEDTSVSRNVSDADKDPLSITVTTPPLTGTVTTTASSWKFQPPANASGTFAFTLSASDGVAVVTRAITVTVTPVNDAPVAQQQNLSVIGVSSLAIKLTATDVDSSTLSYQIATQPVNGTLSGTAPNLTYTAKAGFSGIDSFNFTSSDGTLTSKAAKITVSVHGALPAPWQTADVGLVGKSGSAGYLYSKQSFAVQGAGADIWGTVDGFRFVYRTLTGDGQIVARVQSQTNTNNWAKAGIMMRDGLTSGAAHAMMVLTPMNGAAFQRRLNTGAVSLNTSKVGYAAPGWVKLVRKGTIFTGFVSTDSLTWTQVGSATITMGQTLSIGLAVTSHTTAALSTAVFDNVSVAQAMTTELNVDFAPATGLVGPGFELDSGAAYGLRPVGRDYGWNVANNTTRVRNIFIGSTSDTIIHLQRPESPNAKWEVAVPDGHYLVQVGLGDPAYIDSVYHLDIEGQAELVLNPTAEAPLFEDARDVEVRDGRLTITNGSNAVNNKIFHVMIIPFPVGYAHRLYVNGAVAKSGHGRTWSQPFRTLGEALNSARANTKITEILVAEGTYKPALTAGVYSTFQLAPNVTVYGGFVAGQDSPADRNLENHASILSGFFGPAITDKVHHVVTGAEGAVLDGFTIADGRAVGTTLDDQRGGGIFVNGLSMSINKCHFEGHFATEGAGLYVKQGTVVVRESAFSANSALNGGGIQVTDGSISVIDCTFKNNVGINELSLGGGIATYQATAWIEGCRFLNNKAGEHGGGLWGDRSKMFVAGSFFSGNSARWGGGTSIYKCEADYANCVFSENYCEVANYTITSTGAGAINSNDNGSMDVRVVNCTLVRNVAKTTSYNVSGALILANTHDMYRNCIFWGNRVPVSSAYANVVLIVSNALMYLDYTLFEGTFSNYWMAGSAYLVDNGNNITGASSAGFFNEAKPDGDNHIFGDLDDGLHLISTSPGAHKGMSAALDELSITPERAEALSRDAAGMPRKTGNTINMGAYEMILPAGNG